MLGAFLLQAPGSKMGNLKSFPTELMAVPAARSPSFCPQSFPGCFKACSGQVPGCPPLDMLSSTMPRSHQCHQDTQPGVSSMISPTGPNPVGVCDAHLSDGAVFLPTAGSKVQLFAWNGLIRPYSITGRIPPCDLTS